MADKENNNLNSHNIDLIEDRPEKKIKIDFKTSPFEKYQNKFSTSLSTVGLGLILVIVGFVLLGYSEGSLRESNAVQGLPLFEAETLKRTNGLVKITGYPIAACEINVPACEENLIYIEKTREEEIDGKWTLVKEDRSWTNFKLGNINITPTQARFVFDLKEKSRQEGEEEENGKMVKYREITTGVADTEKFLVVGELKKGVIDNGSLFIVTNKTSKDLVGYLKEGKMLNWWIFKISAFLLLTLGLTAFVMPILIFLDIFPELGWLLNTIIFILSAIVAFIFVFLSTVVLTYWWLIFIVAGLVIISLVRIKAKSKQKKTINFIP